MEVIEEKSILATRSVSRESQFRTQAGRRAFSCVTAVVLVLGGLLTVPSTAQAASCPSYAAKWVHKSCLSGVSTVASKSKWLDREKRLYERVRLRAGQFRGRTYAYSLYYISNGDYDLEYQRLQLDGNSYGYNWGDHRVWVKDARYTKALRTTSRSDVRFRACTWWWNRFEQEASGKICTKYW